MPGIFSQKLNGPINGLPFFWTQFGIALQFPFITIVNNGINNRPKDQDSLQHRFADRDLKVQGNRCKIPAFCRPDYPIVADGFSPPTRPAFRRGSFETQRTPGKIPFGESGDTDSL